jgi:hypothetical protein
VIAWVPHSASATTPDLRIGTPFDAVGLRAPEVRRVLLAVRHIEDRAVDRHQPPTAIPGTDGGLQGHRTGRLVDQHLQRLRAKFTRAREIAVMLGTCHEPDQRLAQASPWVSSRATSAESSQRTGTSRAQVDHHQRRAVGCAPCVSG